MSDIRRAHAGLVARILGRDGQSPRDQRRAAFENARLAEPAKSLVDKVANAAQSVTDADFERVKAAGLAEDEVFELVICAAVGQATRQWTAARAVLEAVALERGS